MAINSRISRREALKAALLAAGCAAPTISLNALANALNAGAESRAGYLDDSQFALLDAVCETIIPTTDTPGASQAGVPQILDLLLGQWASAETREQFEQALEEIEKLAARRHATDFDELDAEQQYTLLSELDSKALKNPDRPFYLLKKLVIFGYYTSETGGTVELREDRVPGSLSCVPFGPNDRARSTDGWRDEL